MSGYEIPFSRNILIHIFITIFISTQGLFAHMLTSYVYLGGFFFTRNWLCIL